MRSTATHFVGCVVEKARMQISFFAATLKLNMRLTFSFCIINIIKLELDAIAALNVLLFQLLVAITEELLFRGYLRSLFMRILQFSAGAVIVPSTLFAGIRFVLNHHLIQFIVTFVIGIIFAGSFVKIKYGSLYSLILAHLLYDLAIVNV